MNIFPIRVQLLFKKEWDPTTSFTYCICLQKYVV